MEVSRVQAYFDSCGQSLVQELETERDRLSAALDFEAAAHQHTRITKVKSILAAADDIYSRLDQLDAVIVQPATAADSVSLFRFRQGALLGPELFAVTAKEGNQQQEPVEPRLHEVLEKLATTKTASTQQFIEELAILKRWFYRTHKLGEVVFAKSSGELPMRRIANAVGRVHRGEKAGEGKLAVET